MLKNLHSIKIHRNYAPKLDNRELFKHYLTAVK